MNTKKRLVVLASGNGSNLQAILDACKNGDLPAEVVGVISDRKAAFALERARRYGVSTRYHPWKSYGEAGRSRQEYDADLAQKAGDFKPDYIVLAGWMRVLSMPFLSRFPMRVVNLHPALPGAFQGTHAIQRAFEAYRRGEIDRTGVMVHFVPDEGVDVGPVIAQETVPIYPGDTEESLEERVHAVEHRLLVDALKNLFSKNH